MAEPELTENGDHDDDIDDPDDLDDEPLPPAGRPFPILLVAGAVAFLVLAVAGVFIGVQVYSGQQAEARRAAEDAAPRPQHSTCLDLYEYGCDPDRRLPVGLDQLMEAQLAGGDSTWRDTSGKNTTNISLNGTAALRVTVEHAHQVVYAVTCEVNSTGTTPLTDEYLRFLNLCGASALPGNDPAFSGLAQWLETNVHLAPTGLAARYQCNGVAFALKISSLQSELDVTVPADHKSCGTA
ncbi:hypothetical protein [Dactylosporangium sp. NPDC051541]|uniref:hypothetical protein n=1 Tax=Dactylosporangium sp. NPDC051541 TaxID=3363977 RepID=UPI00379DE0B5